MAEGVVTDPRRRSKIRRSAALGRAGAADFPGRVQGFAALWPRGARLLAWCARRFNHSSIITYMTASHSLSCLFAVALIAPTASAQLINWGPTQATLGATDVSLNGTLVVARNLHAAGAAQSPTVNGVPFVGGFAPTGWTNASTLALQASTTGDTNYDLLLNSARATSAAAAANPTGWGAIRLDTLGTLTVGRSYAIQCWFTDQRPGAGTAAIYDRIMTLSSATGPATLTGGEVTNLGALTQGPISGPLDGDLDNNPALGTPDVVFGSYCIGTFTRTSATDQLWLLVQGSHPIPANLLRSHLTAFQIRELPSLGTITPCAFPSSCAFGLSLSTTGSPNIGGAITVSVSGLTTGVPAVGYDFAHANAGPPCGCDIILSPIGGAGAFFLFSSSQVLGIPVDVTLIGATAELQGWEFFGTAGCLVIPTIPMAATCIDVVTVG